MIVEPKNAKAPKALAPKNMTVEATGPSVAAVTFTAMATDLVYGTTLPVVGIPRLVRRSQRKRRIPAEKKDKGGGQA